MVKTSTTLLTLFFTLAIYAQATIHENDSLAEMNFTRLAEKIEQNEGKSLVWPYIRAYITKASSQKNYHELVQAYKDALHESPQELKLTYANKMVVAAKNTSDGALIGSAYLTKGIVNYNLKKYNTALDNYLVADSYIAKTDDKYLKYKIKYNIGHIKYYLGFYDESISLFQDCIVYYQHDNSDAYVSSMHSLALCYTKKGWYQASIKICAKTKEKAESEGVYNLLPYLELCDAINYHYMGNYKQALQIFKKTIPIFAREEDFSNESLASFYTAKSHWKLGQYKNALPYLEKVDRIFINNGYIKPELREAYELLIEYYRKRDNIKTQLLYINKLLKADNILNTNYKYLSQRIHKDYDTAKLTAAKKEAEDTLLREKQFRVLGVAAIALLGVLLTYFIFAYTAAKMRYKRRFEAIINPVSVAGPTEVNLAKQTQIDLNEDVVATILKQLENFESKQGFLDKEITIGKLAVLFDTNSKYVSKVVHHYRNKKFINYIGNLRIDYIIKKLQEDPKLRLYTNKALAEECGFSTTQNFTNSFINRTGISPTYFIRELQKHLDATDNRNKPSASI